MIAVDTNILVYAHRRDVPQHAPARSVLDQLAASSAWAIPWPCVYEFFGVVTHPKIFGVDASTSDQAVDQVDAWLDSGSLTLLAEDTRTWAFVRDVLDNAGVVGPRVHDAKIAAICLSHRVSELWTADRDFSRFAALRTRNPLT